MFGLNLPNKVVEAKRQFQLAFGFNNGCRWQKMLELAKVEDTCSNFPISNQFILLVYESELNFQAGRSPPIVRLLTHQLSDALTKKPFLFWKTCLPMFFSTDIS
jgi:hypothetical protein